MDYWPIPTMKRVLRVLHLIGTSDFCVSPNKFIVNQTKDFLTADVAHYYLFCSPNLQNPFQQSLTVCQRSLTTMQIQIQGLLQFSLPIFPTAQRDLLGIQRLLNSTEFHVHQLTALLDCRGIHKDYLDALMGVCYDGVEGLLYLSLFSLLAACALSAMLCVIFRLWTLMGSRSALCEPFTSLRTAQRVLLQNVKSSVLPVCTSASFWMFNSHPGRKSTMTSMRKTRSTLKHAVCRLIPEGPTRTVSAAT
ncbi:Protein tweety 2-like [Characodon lateralis]|uniref:Protein tweety homolog n=1 Tax=Characodon lateralis TaxID=208331 RepID=A0ABU7CZH8_9TELE|nr:Protein tweety 2-like [Characodon lateralis]